jgi:DNA (cytosine-5)-methyltransferase 1
MGLHRAGFEVVGVDVAPQARYPFTFRQGDALTFPLDGYDLIWASPPCQFASVLTPMAHRAKHPNLIPAIRGRLRAAGVPYIIENVAGARAHLVNPTMLCGSMFGLQVWRHRFFETSFPVFAPASCNHSNIPVLVSGSPRRRRGLWTRHRAPAHNSGGTRWTFSGCQERNWTKPSRLPIPNS